MSDSVATSKRQRVADPLREYAEMVRKYHGTDVHGKEREYVTVTTAEMLNIADQIDREHERRMREQYARGYEDGRRSMDAEHYAVAIRLMHLPLDEDSHGNLSQIAGAIWHSDFGWTQGACRALRDKIVELMGGAREHDAAPPNCDVLCNERQKAIAELRKVCTELDESVWTWIEDVAIAIGAQDGPNDEYESMLPKITCRLIHLLGGDECNFSGVESYMDAMSGKSNPAETSNESTDHVTLVTPSLEDGTCPNDDKTCPNPVQGASITDELRECVPSSDVGEPTTPTITELRRRREELRVKQAKLQVKLDAIRGILDGEP